MSGWESNNSTKRNVLTLRSPKPERMILTPVSHITPPSAAQWIMNSIFPDNESFHRGVTALALRGEKKPTLEMLFFSVKQTNSRSVD